VKNVKLTKEEYQQVAKMIRVGEGAGKRLREFTTKIETTKTELLKDLGET